MQSLQPTCCCSPPLCFQASLLSSTSTNSPHAASAATDGPPAITGGAEGAPADGGKGAAPDVAAADVARGAEVASSLVEFLVEDVFVDAVNRLAGRIEGLADLVMPKRGRMNERCSFVELLMLELDKHMFVGLSGRVVSGFWLVNSFGKTSSQAKCSP